MSKLKSVYAKMCLNDIRVAIQEIEGNIEMYADQGDHETVEYYVELQTEANAVLKEKEHWKDEALKRGREQGYNV